MLDIKLFRENPDVIRNDLKKRGDNEKIKWVDEVIKLDNEWRTLIKKRDDLKSVRNTVSKQIGTIKEAKEKQKKINEMTKNNDEIDKFEKEIETNRERTQYLLDRFPNILDASVPVGKDDSENKEIRVWGKKTSFKFKPKSHQEICELNDWYDIERGAKVAGARNYFLKNSLARLEFAIATYAIDFLRSRGFTFMVPPYMCYKKCFYGTGYLPAGEADLYNIKFEGQDMSLIGTSEVPLASYHMDETLLSSDMPKKYCGYSACFRTEAGSHGKDTKGIFRVHQFNKVEMVILSKPEDSKAMHELLIKTAEEFWQSLEIHYHVVNICTGDIGVGAAKKYDIEAWLPGQEKFREIVSCSNMTDYQARRLNIKYRMENGKPPEGFVHTLNSTCVATVRALVAVIENYQEADGSVKIPAVLVPYMGGIKKIGKD
ncbi:Serine--tRNA ligase [Candidatus Tiddalikarchaeum anstoanum]|nr:Serine--tRNA ligase [Candidatus Tiddalikarchaeum anstoanum]